MNYKKYSIRWLIVKNEAVYKKLGWKNGSDLELSYDMSKVGDIHLFFEPNESLFKHPTEVLNREKERIDMLIRQVFREDVVSVNHFIDDNGIRKVSVELDIDCKFFV